MALLRRLTNTDDSRRLLGRVVEDTLSHIVVQVSTVVIRLNSTLWVMCISVKCIQMRADAFHGSEVLMCISAEHEAETND